MPDDRPEPLRLEIAFEPGADPIAGACSRGDGPAVAFVGWLGLMAVLERIVVDSPSSAPYGRSG